MRGRSLLVAASAQVYPAKPVRTIVPFVPGGISDLLARIVGQKLTEKSGQPFVVDNRAGAGGDIGTEIAARAAPDRQWAEVVKRAGIRAQ